MPYYLFCSRCNEDGSYDTVDRDCGKCDGTGRDWRDDNELSSYHSWAGIDIETLKKKEIIEVDAPGYGRKTFFYRPRMLSTENDLAEIERVLDRKAEVFDYDYFLEPCQLCISRAIDGTFGGQCGWCEDHGVSSDPNYPGLILRFEREGEHYQFHETAHELRKYFKDGKVLEHYTGYDPVNREKPRPDPVAQDRWGRATLDLLKNKSLSSLLRKR